MPILSFWAGTLFLKLWFQNELCQGTAFAMLGMFYFKCFCFIFSISYRTNWTWSGECDNSWKMVCVFDLISWYNILKSEIECRVNYFVRMTTENPEGAMTHDVTPCSPCGKYVTLNATRPHFFSRAGGTSCRRRRSLVLVLSSSPSICRARREPLGQGERWRRWGRS